MWAPPPPPDAQRAPAAILSTSRPPGVPVLPRARLHGRPPAGPAPTRVPAPTRRPRPAPPRLLGWERRSHRPRGPARVLLAAALPPNPEALRSQRPAPRLPGDWCRPGSCKTKPPEARNPGSGMARCLRTGRLAGDTSQSPSFHKDELTTPRCSEHPYFSFELG